MNDYFKLTGQRILVTGGSSGIGKAIAVLLAQLGACVVIVGRDEVRLQRVLSSLEGSGHEYVVCDLVADIEGIPTWLKAQAKIFGSFSGIVHSAGIELTAPIRSTDWHLYRNVMQINSDVAFFLAKGFAQKTCRAVPASIVFISSVASLKGKAGLSVYSMSKGSLISLTRSLAVELAKKNVRVNCISPGYVEGEMDESIRLKMSNEQYASIVNAHPLGLGTPADVAGAVAYLLGRTGRWVTGINLVVDGGYSAQ